LLTLAGEFKWLDQIFSASRPHLVLLKIIGHRMRFIRGLERREIEMNWSAGALMLLGMASMAVAACDGTFSEERQEADARKRVEQEVRQWSEIQRIWRSKEEEGQGCAGEILTGDGLRDVVIGKQHAVAYAGVVPDPKDGAAEWRNYKPDGTFVSSEFASIFSGRYSIKETLLCDSVSMGFARSKSCFRLIKSPDGKMMEERLVARGVPTNLAKGQNLSCVEIVVTGLKTDE
jgi:hypothetical protein